METEFFQWDRNSPVKCSRKEGAVPVKWMANEILICFSNRCWRIVLGIDSTLPAQSRQISPIEYVRAHGRYRMPPNRRLYRFNRC